MCVYTHIKLFYRFHVDVVQCINIIMLKVTLIRDNITFTTTDIPSTINTHNIELQMVKVHINNTKHITIANIYIPPRDTTSTHYKTADTDIQHSYSTSRTYHTQSSPEM